MRPLSARAAAVWLVAAAAAAAATRWLPADWPLTWILRILGAATLVAVVPGACVLCAWRPRSSFAALEFAALSLGVSFGLLQLLTVAAITLHLAPVYALGILLLVVIGHAAAAARAPNVPGFLGAGRAEIGVMVLLAVLALYLYDSGSRFDDVEDRIHVAIVQRLAYLDAPRLSNLYFVPDVVYTYPFPGIHYMVALMSRVGDVDALFLYHKLRAFWGAAAVLLLYGCARAVFERARIALAVAVVAIGLVATGSFAAVPGLYWAQVAPYSHASDVAMGVLLPALLMLTFAYLRAATARERRFFLAAAAAMTLMLIVVHPREIVQFLVYLTAFCAALLIARAHRPLLGRAAVLLLAATALLLVYRVWHQWAVPHVDSLVAEHRMRLHALFVRASWGERLGPPLPLMTAYMPAFAPTFHGWNALCLLASPVVLYVCRRAPLTLFVAASIACYFLIVRFPVFGIPYAYVTYHEILYTPIRNVIFFVHLLVGVSLYVAAARFARFGYLLLTLSALGVAGVLVVLFRTAGPYLAARPDLLFVPVIAGFAVFAVRLWRGGGAAIDDGWLLQPRRRWVLAFALLLLPIVAGARVEEAGIVNGLWANRWPTPDAFAASMACADGRQFCAPPAALVRYAHTELPAAAVLAVDRHESYQPAMFLPQQMVVWTGDTAGIVRPEELFAKYYVRLVQAQRGGQEQPFFNAAETREERLSFVRDLGVTHVLVNPRTYPVMTPVLRAEASLFTPRYDDGAWAVYEVRR